jgi:hypothetical protein
MISGGRSCHICRANGSVERTIVHAKKRSIPATAVSNPAVVRSSAHGCPLVGGDGLEPPTLSV